MASGHIQRWDTHSKWMEVHTTHSATSLSAIKYSRRSFAALSLPEVIVSDNAATFSSDECVQLKKIFKWSEAHKAPPYHPASNDRSERALQIFKEGMKKLKHGSLVTQLSGFLSKYRLTPQSSTGVSPAELVYGQHVRSPLHNLCPHLSRKGWQGQEHPMQGHNAHSELREFPVGDMLCARHHSQGPVWLPGEVTGVQGSVLYTILLENGQTVCQHMD